MTRTTVPPSRGSVRRGLAKLDRSGNHFRFGPKHSCSLPMAGRDHGRGIRNMQKKHFRTQTKRKCSLNLVRSYTCQLPTART